MGLKVSFVSWEGGDTPRTIEDQDIAMNSYITQYPSKSKTMRSGYTFGGWYEQAELLTSYYINNKKVTTAFSIYAKWIPITYTYDGVALEEILEPAYQEFISTTGDIHNNTASALIGDYSPKFRGIHEGFASYSIEYSKSEELSPASEGFRFRTTRCSSAKKGYRPRHFFPFWSCSTPDTYYLSRCATKLFISNATNSTIIEITPDAFNLDIIPHYFLVYIVGGGGGGGGASGSSHGSGGGGGGRGWTLTSIPTDLDGDGKETGRDLGAGGRKIIIGAGGAGGRGGTSSSNDMGVVGGDSYCYYDHDLNYAKACGGGQGVSSARRIEFNFTAPGGNFILEGTAIGNGASGGEGHDYATGSSATTPFVYSPEGWQVFSPAYTVLSYVKQGGGSDPRSYGLGGAVGVSWPFDGEAGLSGASGYAELWY